MSTEISNDHRSHEGYPCTHLSPMFEALEDRLLLAADTELIDMLPDGTIGNGDSALISISADGRFVAFVSGASNLVPNDTNNCGDVFVCDRVTGGMQRLSVSSDGGQAFGDWPRALAISGNGRYVAFASRATGLVTNDTNDATDVFVHDRTTHTTERVSVTSTGAQSTFAIHSDREHVAISDDGRFVAFTSTANNLIPGNRNVDANGYDRNDVYVRDRVSSTTERVSVASDSSLSNGSCYNIEISADGRYVVFQSDASSLVPLDTNNATDVFVRDRLLEVTERISVSTAGMQGSTKSFFPSISANGRHLAFLSTANNLVLGDAYQGMGIYVRDRQGGTTIRCNITITCSSGWLSSPRISPDGTYVAFLAAVSNVVQVYLYNIQMGSTECISVSSTGTVGDESSGWWTYSEEGCGPTPALSSGAGKVAFISYATNLVPSPYVGNYQHVFVRDRTGTNSPPSIGGEAVLAGGVEDTDRTITYQQLATATGAQDPDGDAISFRIESITSGTLTKNGTAVIPGVTMLSTGESLVWHPALNANGTLNAFTLKAWDGQAASVTTAQVRVQVAPVNDPPTLTTVNELTGAMVSTPFPITYAALAAAANEADVDGDAVSFRVESISSGTLTKNGTAVLAGTTLLSAGESLVWLPSSGASGALDAFTIRAYDGSLVSPTSVQVKVNVVRVNQPPSLTDISTLGGAIEDTAFTITHQSLSSAANASDPDSDPISFRVESVTTGTLTKNGVAVVPGATILSTGEALVWVPASNANGTLNAFTVKAWDGQVASATAVQVRAQVAPVNDPPTLSTVSVLTGGLENTPFLITYATLAAAANEADIDGDPINFRIESVKTGMLTKDGMEVSEGVTLLSEGDAVVWSPSAGSAGVASAFTVKAYDGGLTSGEAIQVKVMVAYSDGPPVLTTVNTLLGAAPSIEFPITFAALFAASDAAYPVYGVFSMEDGLTSLDMATVGNPGNAADMRYNIGTEWNQRLDGFGRVAYTYQIGKYEVTAGQYAEFLNAVAQTDPYGLYNENMWSHVYGCKIERIGSSGNYSYAIAADRANRPVNYVSFWDAARFSNWLHNGQGNGDTETGAYTLNGYNGSDGREIVRGAEAKFFIPTEDEWYKAAFHKNDGVTAHYWDYPVQSNSDPASEPPPGRIGPPGSANYCYYENQLAVGPSYYTSEVGAYVNSSSPYGTFDQGGNVTEWNERLVVSPSRGLRGGWFKSVNPVDLALSALNYTYFRPDNESYSTGFRIAGAVEDRTLSLRIEEVTTGTLKKDGADVVPGETVFSPGEALFWQPPADANGTVNAFTVTAWDGQAASATPVQVKVEVNPINEPPGFTKGTDQTVNEDSGPKTIAGWATGIVPGPANEAGQAMTFLVTNDNTGLFSVQPSITVDGTLTFTPAANANGAATVNVRLQDDGGTANGGQDTSDPQIFTITVNPVNDAPSFTKGGDQTVLEDAGSQTVTGWATSVSAGPSDEAGQALTFLVTNDNNTLFSGQPVIAANGTLTFTPAPNANGTATVAVRVQDDGGTADGGQDTSNPQTFTITVNPVNDPPSFIEGVDQTVNEDSGLRTVSGWATGISPGPANEVGQVLTFLVTNSNNALFTPGGQPALTGNGTLAFTPAPNANGTATVIVCLKDDGGRVNGGQDTSASQTFTITVNPVNDPPSFIKGPDQTVVADGVTRSVPNWATSISSGPADEAAQTTTFLITNDNNALFAVQPAVAPNGTLTFAPAAGMGGTAMVTVRLQDNEGTANGGQDTTAAQTFTISFGRVLDARGTHRFTDASGDRVTVQLVGGGTGILFFPTQGNSDLARIVLTGTSERSMLMISGRTSVGGIECDGPLGRIIAQTTDLSGNVTIGPAASATATTMLMFGNVIDADIQSAMPISTFLASSWLDTDATADALAAPTVGSMIVRGDFQADVHLSEVDRLGNSLTMLNVTGNVTGSTLTLAGGANVIYARSWAGGAIDGRYVNTIVATRGGFGASLNLTGQNAAGNSLNLLSVLGALTSPTATLAGSAGTIIAGSWPAGTFQAASAGTMMIRGAMGASVNLTGQNRMGNSVNMLYAMGAVTSPTIALAGAAGTVMAGSWAAGQFTAGSVSTFMSRGGFAGNLTLTGQNAIGRSLNVFQVIGEMASGVVRTRGGIGSALIGSMRGSGLYASVLDGVAGMPAPGAAAGEYFAVLPAGLRGQAIGTLMITRPAGVFANSVVAAPSMGTVILRGVQTVNGATSFGLTADTKISTVIRYRTGSAPSIKTNITSSLAELPAEDDFGVNIV